MGPFFSKARYMNGVGFEILAHTPVPKLPPPPPSPPQPNPKIKMLHSMASVLGITLKTPRKPASENVVCL